MDYKKDGLVDAYDNNAMEFVRISITEYEFSREDQDNYAIRTNVQQKHGNWNLTKKLFLLLYHRKGDPIISKMRIAVM
jgi:hypothetical protein